MLKKNSNFGLQISLFPSFFGGWGREHHSKMYGIANFFDLSSYMLQKMVFIAFYLRHPTVGTNYKIVICSIYTTVILYHKM
jgi:hypothetical protein